MEFNVAQLLKGPVGAVRDYHFNESLGSIEDVGWAGPGEGDVRLTRTSRGVLARVHLSSSVHSACSRCLVDFDGPVEIEFVEEFLPTVDVETGVSIEVDEEDAAAFTIDERHTLDLHEAVRQYALLVLPMRPLCREDCRGLCLECGANLNLETCRCPQVPVDHRWAALANLAKLSDDKKGAT